MITARSTVLFALLSVGIVPTIRSQSLIGRQSSVVNNADNRLLLMTENSWRRDIPHYGKWLTAAGVAALTIMGAAEHRQSNRDWNQLLTICHSAQDACATGPDGRCESLAARRASQPARDDGALHYRSASGRAGEYSLPGAAAGAAGRWRCGGRDASGFLADPEQLKPPLIARDNPLAIRGMVSLLERGIRGDHRAGRLTRRFEQRHVGFEIRIAERHAA